MNHDDAVNAALRALGELWMQSILRGAAPSRADLEGAARLIVEGVGRGTCGPGWTRRFKAREGAALPEALDGTLGAEAAVTVPVAVFWQLLVDAAAAPVLLAQYEREDSRADELFDLILKAHRAFHDPALADRTHDRRAAAAEALGLDRPAFKKLFNEHRAREYLRLRDGEFDFATMAPRAPCTHEAAIAELARRHDMTYEAMEQRLKRVKRR